MSGNIPYIKEYKDGKLINPITSIYASVLPNRKARREAMRTPRFFGNGKNYSLTVTRTNKYKRFVQLILQKDGSTKTILHYL